MANLESSTRTPQRPTGPLRGEKWRALLAGNIWVAFRRDVYRWASGCVICKWFLGRRFVRLGLATAMAKVIEYYVPQGFRRSARWIPPDQRGKIIEFSVPQKKSA